MSVLSLEHPKVHVSVFSGVVWFGSVWISANTPSSLVFTVNGLRDERLPFYLGWVKTSVADSDGTYSAILPQQLAHSSVGHLQSGPYLDFYCNDLRYCRSLLKSGFFALVHNFGYEHVSQTFPSAIKCEPCSVCSGLHRDACPFLALQSPQCLTLQSTDLDAAKDFFASGGGLPLEREDLALGAINFVKQKGLLLVSFGSSRDCFFR